MQMNSFPPLYLVQYVPFLIQCLISEPNQNTKCVSNLTFLWEAEQLKTDESEILNIKSRESIERKLGNVTSIWNREQTSQVQYRGTSAPIERTQRKF